MSFKEVISLDCDNAIQLGGTNKKTGKANPTKLEGFYLGSKEVPSKKAKTGFSKLHAFQTPKGTIGVWGKTDLDSKLATVTLGFMTRVSYTGMKETKNNPMYVYKVEVDSDSSIEVGATAVFDNESASDDSASVGDDAAYADDGDDTDPGAEEAQPDEAPPARATPPRHAAKAPAPAQQKQVQDLLRGRRPQ